MKGEGGGEGGGLNDPPGKTALKISLALLGLRILMILISFIIFTVDSSIGGDANKQGIEKVAKS